MVKQKLNSSSKTLSKLRRMAETNPDIITSFVRRYQHCDEPQFFQYSTSIAVEKENKHQQHTLSGSGSSFFSDGIARIKCLAESFERYCSHIYRKDGFLWSSYKNLPDQGVSPKVFCPFSDRQLVLSGYEMFGYDENENFNWIEGFRYPSFKKTYLPAQLIYTSSVRDENERIIRFPISTGAAGGFDLESALYGGICEIVERDSFMIMYLNKTCRCKVDIDKIKDLKIQTIINKSKRYLLGIQVFDITSDLGIPSFMAIVVDQIGYGMAVSTGLKTDVDSRKAILGAMQEAFHTRSWIRSAVEEGEYDPKNINSKNITVMKERGAFWFSRERIKKLKYLLDLPVSSDYTKSIDMSKKGKKSLETILDILIKNQMEVYFKDLATLELKKHGFITVKVLIPQLQPVYFNEHFPYLGNKRIYEVPKKLGLVTKVPDFPDLNLYPHPFL